MKANSKPCTCWAEQHHAGSVLASPAASAVRSGPQPDLLSCRVPLCCGCSGIGLDRAVGRLDFVLLAPWAVVLSSSGLVFPWLGTVDDGRGREWMEGA